MADLNNLLDDIETNEDDDQQLPHDEDDEGGDEVDLDDGEGEGQITAPRAGIPAVLAAAAQQRRRQLDQQQDDVRGLGAGREERDYQAASGKDFGDDDFGDDVDGYGGSGEGGEGRIPDQDYEQLKHLWTLELASPELMPQDSETVALHVEVLAGQEESVEDLLKQSKVNQQQQPGGGGGAGGATGELASLMAQILKMDLDRTRFMLVDLARSRMAKIENHALFNRTLVDRMTEEEISYLAQYGELLDKHYCRTVLDHLPKEAWKKLDEPEMIDTPNLEEFVFCRVLETVQIDVSGENNGTDIAELLGEEDEDYGDTIQEHHAGACLIVMYKTIRDLVLEGKIELLC